MVFRDDLNAAIKEYADTDEAAGLKGERALRRVHSQGPTSRRPRAVSRSEGQGQGENTTAGRARGPFPGEHRRMGRPHSRRSRGARRLAQSFAESLETDEDRQAQGDPRLPAPDPRRECALRWRGGVCRSSSTPRRSRPTERSSRRRATSSPDRRGIRSAELGPSPARRGWPRIRNGWRLSTKTSCRRSSNRARSIWPRWAVCSKAISVTTRSKPGTGASTTPSSGAPTMA